MSIEFTRPQINRDERMLWIHAGPHKAASSYVTERLRQNRDHLAAQGVLMDGYDNCLANAIAQKNYAPVEEALATLPSSLHRVLLSSSSLDDRILSRTALGRLQVLVERQGFKLGVSYFVRDQQSWLNSVYAHRVRRFRETPDFEQYCDYIMHDSDSWDISYPSKFRVLSRFPSIATLFLPLSKQVAIADPFLALVDALGLDAPSGEQGWLAGRSSKQNIQPGARGIWMSALCRRLMVETGFDPEVLKRKGKVIRDLAIELGWDREKFDGFDQSLHDRVSSFYASSNEAFAQEHWGVSWDSLFPVRSAVQQVYSGPEAEAERKEMRGLMVRVLRELRFPWRLRRRFFSLYDATV
ncbi:hypothetical protein [Synechococcus sp. HB1133]|uniref:hypothetical protein n=1 Tax=Synechococcus sp. HB1133 TaxID=2508568 RepID=UPI0014076F36|nr:hypothetical protein [Synechococcus sp. HB1133]